MPYKDVLKRREAHKRYYLKNKGLYRNKNLKRKKELAAFVISLKQRPCTDCGNDFPPYVMDFDHKEGSEKRNSIARLIRDGCSRKLILNEIEKCDLVCANCHRIRTYRRFNVKYM